MSKSAILSASFLLASCGSSPEFSIAEADPTCYDGTQGGDGTATLDGGADAGGTCPTSGAQGAIAATVSGLRNDHGMVFVALFSSAAGFSANEALRGGPTAITGKTATLVFHDVPPGTYAVSFFHDENGNGKLDTNAFGIPTEGFGFSRDGQGTFGPPDFGQIDFDHENTTEIQDLVMHAVYY